MQVSENKVQQTKHTCGEGGHSASCDKFGQHYIFSGLYSVSMATSFIQAQRYWY